MSFQWNKHKHHCVRTTQTPGFQLLCCSVRKKRAKNSANKTSVFENTPHTLLELLISTLSNQAAAAIAVNVGRSGALTLVPPEFLEGFSPHTAFELSPRSFALLSPESLVDLSFS